MLLHDGKMQCVARRQPFMSQDNLFGTFNGGPINLQHLVNHAKQGVKSRLDGIPAVDSHVAVQNLLQDLGVRDQALPLNDQLLE